MSFYPWILEFEILSVYSRVNPKMQFAFFLIWKKYRFIEFYNITETILNRKHFFCLTCKRLDFLTYIFFFCCILIILCNYSVPSVYSYLLQLDIFPTFFLIFFPIPPLHFFNIFAAPRIVLLNLNHSPLTSLLSSHIRISFRVFLF